MTRSRAAAVSAAALGALLLGALTGACGNDETGEGSTSTTRSTVTSMVTTSAPAAGSASTDVPADGSAELVACSGGRSRRSAAQRRPTATSSPSSARSSRSRTSRTARPATSRRSSSSPRSTTWTSPTSRRRDAVTGDQARCLRGRCRCGAGRHRALRRAAAPGDGVRRCHPGAPEPPGRQPGPAPARVRALRLRAAWTWHAEPMTNPLDDLVGRWVGEGSGDYPTIEPFTYREVLEIVAVPGRPLATWRSTTVDGPTGEPRHSEVGFLRRTVDGAELVLAHGFGVTEIAVVTPGGPGELPRRIGLRLLLPDGEVGRRRRADDLGPRRRARVHHVDGGGRGGDDTSPLRPPGARLTGNG